jgi:hypothetical protein
LTRQPNASRTPAETTNKDNKDNNNIKEKIYKKEKEKTLLPLINQVLSREQLYKISIKKNVWCPLVIKKYYAIRDLIEGGEFKPKWGKNLNLILQKWIDMAIARGELKEMDEVQQELNKSYVPNSYMGKDLFDRAEKARKEGRL